MNAPSVDVTSMLDGDSSGADSHGTYGVDLFSGREPPSPDECITVLDTGGFPPVQTMDKTEYFRPTVQIRVRGARGDYEGPYNRALSILRSLNDRYQESWGGSFYTGVSAMNDPFFVGWDDNGRAVFTINFRLERVPGS